MKFYIKQFFSNVTLHCNVTISVTLQLLHIYIGDVIG